MAFIHDDRDFRDLVRIVARDRGLSTGLVEKDYWVTHALWAVTRLGLDVWFKGGTSLSKGFGLIQRFSEDLDLRIEQGTRTDLPPVASWTSENSGRVAQRRAFFEALGSTLVVPGASVGLDVGTIDKRARGAEYRVLYPGRFLQDLGDAMRPFVLLEVGAARVLPFVPRHLTSFLHDWLEQRGQIAGYTDNRPRDVRCVHPLVTLLEKLDGISRRYARTPMEPASFVRHYEDAAHIIRGLDTLPPLPDTPLDLARDMLEQHQITGMPSATDAAFVLAPSDRRRELERAYDQIGPMYWGERVPLDEACASIRSWIDQNLTPASS